IDFERELSVVAARAVDGSVAAFVPIENTHDRHILEVPIAPANVAPEIAAQAVDIAAAILQGLEYIGVLCVEFFLARDGRLLINEIAPLPPNEGNPAFDA